MNKTYVLIGASSDLAKSFKKILINKNEKFISISRSKDAQVTVVDYFKESDEIINQLKNYNNLYVIFFNGYLAENRPSQKPNHNDIVKTDYINFTIPYSLSDKFISHGLDVTKFIYISSVAAIKPRYKNFIYGLSKYKLEKTIPTITDEYLIFRFGKIQTKMSEKHSNVPFTLKKELAAEIMYKKIEKKHIVYPSFKIKFISSLISFLPLMIVNLSEKKIIIDE
jgi:short-subunit dehydrogenase